MKRQMNSHRARWTRRLVKLLRERPELRDVGVASVVDGMIWNA